jgi:hypothetical protein
MDFNSTIDLIKREIDEAYEIIDNLKKSPGIQTIQLELAKSKCRNAAMAMELLKDSKKEPDNQTPEAAKASSATVVKPEPGKDTDKIPAEMIIPGKQGGDPFEIPAEDPVKKIKGNKEPEKPVIDLVTEPVREEKKDIEETDPDLVLLSEDDNPQKNKPFAAPIIADSFSHLANTFNEHMGRKADDSSILKKKPVTSLSSAIAVNDKFYFIREIFNGDKNAYTSAINDLENVKNIEEAKVVLKGYGKQGHDDEATNQLLELIKRKLSPDE